jgi:transcriptional regulator of acetoin/glycerol metabolism
MEAPTDAPPQTPIDRALRVLAVEEAAGVLGIDPATLWRRRKKYGRLVDGGS